MIRYRYTRHQVPRGALPDAETRGRIYLLDRDGGWSPAEAVALRTEFETISEELAGLPPRGLPAGWQQTVARSVGLSPENLRDCFFDVDGEPLIDRLMGLCRCSAERGLPILFQ